MGGTTRREAIMGIAATSAAVLSLSEKGFGKDSVKEEIPLAFAEIINRNLCLLMEQN